MMMTARKYPMHTVAQARLSLLIANQDRNDGTLSAAAFAAVRARLQAQITKLLRPRKPRARRKQPSPPPPTPPLTPICTASFGTTEGF